MKAFIIVSTRPYDGRVCHPGFLTCFMGTTPWKNNIFFLLSERTIYMRSYITMTTEINDTTPTTIDILDSEANNNDEQFSINTSLPNYLIQPLKK